MFMLYNKVSIISPSFISDFSFVHFQELAWKEKEPEERKLNFIPQKYSCLRHVPSYARFINERFERCLDLYLCPRQRKMRVSTAFSVWKDLKNRFAWILDYSIPSHIFLSYEM